MNDDQYVAEVENALGRKLSTNEMQHDIFELRDQKVTPRDAAENLRE